MPAKTPARPILLVSAISPIEIFLFFIVGNIEKTSEPRFPRFLGFSRKNIKNQRQ